jgi:hypothetical protein
MRKLIPALMIVAALVLVLGVAACGDVKSADQAKAIVSPAAQPAGSAQNVLAKMAEASKTVSGGRATFQVQLGFDVDASKLPAEAKAFVTNPISLSGQVAVSADPVAGDMGFTIAAGGKNTPLDIGIRYTADKAWIRLGTQWYEAPPEVQKAFSQAMASQTKSIDFLQLFSKLGVDPMSWLTNLQMTDDAQIGGTQAYHITGSPDINRMMADVMKLMQSSEFSGMLNPTGTSDTMETPNPSDLQQAQQELTSMLKNAKIDLWVGKESYQLLKMDLALKIGLPADASAEGLNGIDLAMTAQMGDSTKPVTVEPPTDVKPAAQLEQDMQGMFQGLSGLFGGVMPSIPTGTETTDMGPPTTAMSVVQ